MPIWTPKYNTQFVEPIITNLLVYIKAHIADALLWANGGSVQLPPPLATSIYDSAIGLQQEVFPDLMVLKVMTPTLDESADASEVGQRHDITFLFGLLGTDVTELTHRTWRYMKAYDSVCRAIPNASLYSGMNGTGHGMIEVIKHNYGIPKPYKEGQYVADSMFLVAVQFGETRNNSFV